MRIIFAGTPEFATPALEGLLESKHEVIAVYTQPDRPSGRGQKLTPSPVKQLAQKNQIPIFQPITLRDDQEQKKLQLLNPDLMVVVAYGLILPKTILNIPKYGCLNIHASLLPRWRGAAPIQRAILAGDSETGVTIMQMDEGLDTGPMLGNISYSILKTDTSLSLQKKLSTLGKEALIKIIDSLEIGNLKPKTQNDIDATYAKKIEKSEAEINWSLSAAEIDRQIRGYNPWPVAYTKLNNQILKIWQAEVLESKSTALPGVIIQVDKHGIDIGTGEGILRITQLQLPNSRSMSVLDVLNSKANLFQPGVKFGI